MPKFVVRFKQNLFIVIEADTADLAEDKFVARQYSEASVTRKGERIVSTVELVPEENTSVQ